MLLITFYKPTISHYIRKLSERLTERYSIYLHLQRQVRRPFRPQVMAEGLKADSGNSRCLSTGISHALFALRFSMNVFISISEDETERTTVVNDA